MRLKLGMWISVLFAGRSGSRDLTLGCAIWNIYGKELLSVWHVSWGGVDRRWFHSRLVSGVGGGVKCCWNRGSSNFSSRNKFIPLLPCGPLVDNNTLPEMCVFKSLTGYTDYGGYVVKRDSVYTHIRVGDHIVAGRSHSSTNPLNQNVGKQREIKELRKNNRNIYVTRISSSANGAKITFVTYS